MNYTVIGDPHCKPDNLDKINKLFDIVEGLELPAIWLGDFLDTKEVVRGKCLNLIFKRLKESKLDHTILVGNHDWFNLQCKAHSLEVLKDLPNVVVIDKPLHIEESKMSFLPYIHDPEELKKAIKGCYAGGVVFGHFEFPGFDYGNGHICENGYSHKHLPTIKTIISGHFHKFQQKDNVTYLGTPFSHSFGESNQTKYIGIFNSKTHKLELMETTFPKHITFEGVNLEDLQAFNDDCNYVRIINNDPNIKIDKSQYPNLKIIERFNVKKNPTEYVVNDTESNETKFQKWGKEVKNLPEKTLNLGLEILRGVQ